ncbi:MAG: fumarylacetoacetate hydrolase family protein [Proteobacteria bacterium]|nr:fumarylacetoacetate hydrolase family protein [Pseudomonadota bacterium]MDA0993909.1 fumarylacetoacetate hydrolase family protein [Pseudomonadota bacterium]
MSKGLAATVMALSLFAFSGAVAMAAEISRYVRYSFDNEIHYGIEDGDEVHQLDGAPWAKGSRTGISVAASDVTLLAPAEPSKVIAVGYNYISHREEMTHEENRPIPEYPPIFLKLPTTITGPDTEVPYPADATDLHFEGELVVIIGKTARNVAAADAAEYIFGVTAGNDISERSWQANDLQWFRAKGTDKFGPLGPAIVTGLNYLDLRVQTRLNGETMQNQSSKDQIHNIHAVVSYISQYVTLYPGDIIYTGTPGATSAMKPGDVVEIEVEGVGILRNRIVSRVD